MAVKLANLVRTKLSLSISATETSIRVLAGHGVRFPTIDTTTDWFPVCLENVNGEVEILRCTGRNGDVLTVSRGQEGTVARGYPSGALCELRFTVASITTYIAENQPGGTGEDTSKVLINVADGELAK